MENTQQISEMLKTAMEAGSISAADLAYKADISIESMRAMLQGKVTSYTDLEKVSGYLKIEIPIVQDATIREVATQENTQNEIQQKTQAAHTQETDILASFILDGDEYAPQEAARMMTQSAGGSWVHSWTDAFVDFENHNKARPISTLPMPNGDISVDMAFPHELVEAGSIPSLLSVLGACLTGTDTKLADIRVPSTLMRTFNGPAWGIRGLRDRLNKYGRPLTSVTIRPMNGLSPRMYGRAAYEALVGGIDFTCDPTMMHSLPGNDWRQRFRFCSEAARAAEDETGERKEHIVNITASTTEEILTRAEYAKEYGIFALSIDTAAVGWTTLASVAKWCRENDQILFAMGGRSLQSGVMSEQLTAKLLRLVGCDVISTGSPLGGQTNKRRRIKGVMTTMTEQNIAPFEENGIHFDQPTCHMESSMPAVGGGHNPWHFARLIDALGDDFIIQCGGSVMGHPWGSTSGATATRTAIEALIKARGEGENLNVEGRKILQKAAKQCDELQMALDHWNEGAFLFGVIDNNTSGKVEKK